MDGCPPIRTPEQRGFATDALIQSVRSYQQGVGEMALEFKLADINFSNVRGTQRQTRTVSFQNFVNTAQTAVRGFLLEFPGRTDITPDRIQVLTTVLNTAHNDVEVEAAVILRDNKGDDDYNATVNVLVIADT
jgi:hypothetical protein